MQQDVSCSLVHTHTHTHSLSTGGNCLLVSTRRGYRQQLTSRSPHNLFWVLPWKQNMRLSCWYQNQQLPCLLCIELKWLLLLNPFHSARPPKGYSVSSFLPPQTFSPTSNMCTIHDIWSSHFMLINHMLQQQEEGRVAGCYYKPTRLPNERLEFESHHWIFLRTAGDVSICFLLGDKTRCYLRSGWGGGHFLCLFWLFLFLTGSGTISIHEPGNQNKYFEPNRADCFLTLTELFLCLSPTHSAARREKQKIQSPQTETLRRKDLKNFRLICGSPWHAIMMKGDSLQFTIEKSSASDVTNTNPRRHTNTVKTSRSLSTFVLLVWLVCFCTRSSYKTKARLDWRPHQVR